MEMEISSLNDCMMRLTKRVFILEDFIKNKFGEDLSMYCGCTISKTKNKSSKKKYISPSRKKTNLCSQSTSKVEESSNKQAVNELLCENRTTRTLRKRSLVSSSDDETDDREYENFSATLIKNEVFSEQCSDDLGDGDTMINTDFNIREKRSHSFPEEDEDELEDDIEERITKAVTPKWIYKKDFPNKGAAELEIGSEWKLKCTITNADGQKLLYCCKKDNGDTTRCPAKARLVCLNNLEIASYSTNNLDHIHTEDALYGFNTKAKQTIDKLLMEGLSDEESIVKALIIRNIKIEKTHLSRYIANYQKEKGTLTTNSNPKRNSYSAPFKLQVCDLAEHIGNRAAARKFNLNEKCIRYWRTTRASLEKLAPEKNSLRHRAPKWPQLEKDLQQWIFSQKQDGAKLTTPIIRKQAEVMAQRHNITDFTSSNGWLDRFMTRTGESFKRKRTMKKNIESPEDMIDNILDSTELNQTSIPSAVIPSTSQRSGDGMEFSDGFGLHTW